MHSSRRSVVIEYVRFLDSSHYCKESIHLYYIASTTARGRTGDPVAPINFNGVRTNKKLLNPSSGQLFQIQHYNDLNETLEKKNHMRRPRKGVRSPHNLITRHTLIAAVKCSMILIQLLLARPDQSNISRVQRPLSQRLLQLLRRDAIARRQMVYRQCLGHIEEDATSHYGLDHVCSQLPETSALGGLGGI
jgi:hypothetical protein